MTSRERFEAWLIDEMGPHALAGDTMSMYEAMNRAWQACEAQSAARIAQLEGENGRLKRQVEVLRNPWSLTSPRYKNLMSRYMPGVFNAIEALTNHQGE